MKLGVGKHIVQPDTSRLSNLLETTFVGSGRREALLHEDGASEAFV